MLLLTRTTRKYWLASGCVLTLPATVAPTLLQLPSREVHQVPHTLDRTWTCKKGENENEMTGYELWSYKHGVLRPVPVLPSYGAHLYLR